MEYKFVGKSNFEDFSSGRVIYHKSNLSTFPVRLAQEIFMRCLEYSYKKKDLKVYDPLCGESYLLTVLGLLNSEKIGKLIGSDINKLALEFARKNLGLLSVAGMKERKKELENMYERFGKESHKEALESADRFLENMQQDIPFQLFQNDVLETTALKGLNFKADIIISDLPYGSMVSWKGENVNSATTILKNMVPVLTAETIIAIISDKSQKWSTEGFTKLERLKVGKRKVEIVKMAR